MRRILQVKIPDDAVDSALVEFLRRRFPYLSREQWGARIAQGRVLINGAATTADYKLARADHLESLFDDIPEPPVRLDFTILHEDADLLVVDKPPNLPCHPSGPYFNHTLWAALQDGRGIAAPSIINRLDRETSGLVIVAKNTDATRRCRMQFAKRQVEKGYIALVEGAFPETLSAQGCLVADDVSPAGKRRKFVSLLDGAPVPPGGETAITQFRLIALHGAVSEVEATPETGRRHQIRATLQSLGFPVVGDKLYGPDPAFFLRFCTDALTAEDRARLRMDRQALHSSRLRFRHPRTHEPVEFCATLPADMADCMSRC